MTILIIDDSYEFTETMTRLLRRDGYEVQTAHSGRAGLAVAARLRPRLILLDLHLSDTSGLELLAPLATTCPDSAVAIVTAEPELSSALVAIKSQVVDYLVKPFAFDELRAVLRKAFRDPRPGRAAPPVESDEVPAGTAAPDVDMIGESAATQDVRVLLRQLAQAGVRGALITGESGTGKDLAARLLHAWGPRRHGPFLEVNCGAVSGELFESEFFGHERGAFTGAIRSRRGFVELADGGTLFLDEVAEIPLPCQPKLLRFLEDRTFVRVGGDRKVTADVQIVAATNRDLRAMVEQWAFRADLYFRLNVVPVSLPPLRERREDILPLAAYWLEKANAQYGRKVVDFSAEARTLLVNHDWPGNVRELRNLIERLVILSRRDVLGVDDFPPEYRGTAPPVVVTAEAVEAAPAGDSLAALERAHIDRVLARVGGNKTKAAEILGISRSTLRTKLAER